MNTGSRIQRIMSLVKDQSHHVVGQENYISMENHTGKKVDF